MRDAWNYSSGATVLKLDLKSTGQNALDSLIRFIEARPTEQQLLIVSKSQDALAYLDESLPDMLEFFRIATGSRHRSAPDRTMIASTVSMASPFRSGR